MEGWIKLFRKFCDWEWYNISAMVHLFIHLLLNANHEDGEWRGVKIKRGQILTGLNKLHQETKISYQTLRTSLKRLEKTKEINIQVTNKYSIITICNYESYQTNQQTTNILPNKQLTFKQHSTNIQLTTNNNKENNKNEDNEDKKEGGRKKFIPPSETDVVNYFIENGYKPAVAKKAFLYYSEMNWHDSQGKQIKSWKGKMVAVWFKDENKEKSNANIFDTSLNDEKNRFNR